jgi:DNA invertase Pin-like site-specific DNA recombinase
LGDTRQHGQEEIGILAIIAAARAKGVKFGRPRLVTDKLQTEAQALKERGIAMPEIARRLNLGVSTTYRLLAEAKAKGDAAN